MDSYCARRSSWRKYVPAARLCVALLSAATGAGAAHAVTSPYPDLVITSQIANSYSYQIGSGAEQTFDPAAGDVHLRIGANEGGSVSELGLDLTATLAGDSFSYLHNGYCIGTCSVRMATSLTFQLTNNGDTPLSVRWDSLITPGHLAQVGLGGSALFQFEIFQVVGSDTSQQTLYSAIGLTGGFYDTIDTATGPFNGLFHEEHSETTAHLNARTISDWSATNVNLDLLTIDPHTTSILGYASQVQMGGTANCTDLAACDGVQVAFGDPRTSGTTPDDAQSRFASRDGTGSAPPESYIGRDFGVFVAPSAFVTPDTPLPPTPPILPRVTYGAPFVSQVPEPTSWALLLCGFGLMGATLRRRASLLRAGG